MVVSAIEVGHGNLGAAVGDFDLEDEVLAVRAQIRAGDLDTVRQVELDHLLDLECLQGRRRRGVRQRLDVDGDPGCRAAAIRREQE
ncbi:MULTISPECIES: hypothetical protein [Mycolicibacterium]|uniref:hypothetical protein n=1 Tax=Mycolicibacterium TaxID=1866885 RepID=UPI000564CC70|nr:MULTISPECIES: hypothetical protein [Mycolicibacterium]WND56768.1 hypothetical protein QQA43_29690 [Mycolicibacterium vanbaalenii]